MGSFYDLNNWRLLPTIDRQTVLSILKNEVEGTTEASYVPWGPPH